MFDRTDGGEQVLKNPERNNFKYHKRRLANRYFTTDVETSKTTS